MTRADAATAAALVIVPSGSLPGAGAAGATDGLLSDGGKAELRRAAPPRKLYSSVEGTSQYSPDATWRSPHRNFAAMSGPRSAAMMMVRAMA